MQQHNKSEAVATYCGMLEELRDVCTNLRISLKGNVSSLFQIKACHLRRRQAITRENASILSIAPTVQTSVISDNTPFAIRQIYFQMSSAKCRPFCSDFKCWSWVKLPRGCTYFTKTRSRYHLYKISIAFTGDWAPWGAGHLQTNNIEKKAQSHNYGTGIVSFVVTGTKILDEIFVTRCIGSWQLNPTLTSSGEALVLTNFFVTSYAGSCPNDNFLPVTIIPLKWHFRFSGHYPVDTWRNNSVIITSKRRCDVVLT